MDINADRKRILVGLVISILTILAIRLFSIQVIDRKYRISAENNALRYETRYPSRGLICDRNGKVIVGNRITYDISVTPYIVKQFDTTGFCSIFGVDRETVDEKFSEWRRYRTRIGYQSRVLLKQVPGEQYNVFAEQMYRFPGFSGTPRTSRLYNYDVCGNLLGYLSEVDGDFIRKHPEYRSGDLAGKTGLEQAFEEQLRGEKGYTIYLRDAHGRNVGRFDDGRSDRDAVEGSNVITSIDADLQAYGEMLMKNKVGSLVAIEPSTGEILTLVSSPGIHTSQLNDIRSCYNDLVKDPYRPMYNRAVMSAQPPGSVFKLVNGLIGLQEEVISPGTFYPCYQGYIAGKLKVGCHNHPSPLDLHHAIMMSCNAYFCYAFRAIIDNKKYSSVRESFEKWREYVGSFGFGQKLGSDFPSELEGYIPTAARYDRIHGKNAWKSLSIISLSIGQGELGCTPLHLANLAATIANRGYYYIPHIRKGTEDFPLDERFGQRHYTMIDTSHFETVVEGMRMAVSGGPGATAGIAAIPGISVCGKTGTAQNPHGDDHSVFICFAPEENPKIAVVAYLENAGFGATWAAPTASLLVEKYLCGEICQQRKYLEQRILDANLMWKVKPSRR